VTSPGDADSPSAAQFHLRDLFVLITACAAALGVARALPVPQELRVVMACYLVLALAYGSFRARRWRRAMRRWAQVRKRRAELERWLRERRRQTRQSDVE
jgi:hypothetical protein